MNNIPDIVKKIGEDVASGKVRRAKVRTLFGYYNLHRRRDAGIAMVRADLVALGLETVPDFSIAGFDDQVRFVVLGSSAVATSTSDESVAVEPFLLLSELSASDLDQFRVLLRTYDAFDRLQNEIVGRRLAAILASGQNGRREDRDRFPFFIQVELPAGLGEDDLRRLVEEASAVGASEEVTEETDAVVEVSQETIDFNEVIRHTSDLQAALRMEIADQVRSLRSAIELKVDEVRIESIRTLAKELNNEEALKFIEEFDSDMRKRLESKDEELKEANTHIIRLQSQLEDLDQTLNEGANYEPEDAYPTLSATVQLFSDLAQGSPITVHPNAVKSAARSGCTRRREVMRFLLVLCEFAEALYRRDDLKKPLREWFEERGYEYAQGDSQTASTRYGQERELQQDGEKIQLSEHVTLFPNTPNCVSIYFFRDASARRLLVGYVGPHLRTAGR